MFTVSLKHNSSGRLEGAILRARACLEFGLEEARVHQLLVDSGFRSYEAHHAIVAAKILGW
jgi:hypothetical protein